MLGERIANLRKEMKLSQYDLANLLGYSRGKLSNYEQGTRQPDYETLQRIADFFEVTTDYLLGRTERNENNSVRNNNDENDIESLLDDLEFEIFYKELKGSSEENRRKALDFLKYLNEQEKNKAPRQ